MASAPLVSVIVPAYRAAATIGRAMRSLLAQSEGDWEAIIVADDGDDYRGLLAGESIVDARLRFLSSGRVAAGAPASRNIALAAARGRLVTPLDADDLFAPDRLSRLAPTALAAGAVFDNVRVVDDGSGEPLGTAFPIDEPDGPIEPSRFLAGSTPLKPLARHDLFPAWDEALGLCDDVVLNLRLFDRLGRIEKVAAPLQDYRVRQQSICHSPDAAARAERDYGYVLDRLAGDGFGLADPALRRLAIDAFTRKRDLNRAYDAAYRAGRTASFQAFVAGLADDFFLTSGRLERRAAAMPESGTMPELPDITTYIEALERRLLDRALQDIRLGNPFVLRTVDPPVAAFRGRAVRRLTRLGKRIVLGFDDELFIVLHLMIAGRLHWRSPGAALVRRLGLAAFDFAEGSVVLTEAGTKRRAALHLLRGEGALALHDPGGLEPLDASRDAFAAALTRENHTVKRALTDPTLFSGIGNAYSDEILHRARLSPVKMTQKLTDDEIDGLHAATRLVLREWIDRLRQEMGEGFPEKVTAFRPEMAAHGKFGRPCPVCGAPIQRIVHADNETNYCARCQNGGRLLADRALSRLLKADWPRTLDELEERRAPQPAAAGGRSQGGLPPGRS